MNKKIIPFFALALAACTVASCSPKATYESVEGMEKTGRVALVDGTDTAGTTWDPVTATNEVERVLTSTGDLTDVVLSNNDGMALGILANQTFKDAKIPVFGVDALADAIQAIKDGTMAGTIKNDSYTQAGVTLAAAKNLIQGKAITEGITEETYPGIYTNAEGKVEVEEGTKALRVHHQMVTKANVDKLVSPQPVTESTIGKTEGAEQKVFALTYNNADPNMSGLWKPGFNDFGKTLNMQVDWVDGQNDDKKAIEAVEQAATKDYDAFLINVVDQTNGAKYIDALKATGKPIIFWNREVKKEQMAAYDKAYYVGIESAEGGRLQGQMAAQYIKENGGFEKFDRNGDGRIGFIVVRGEKGHSDAEARTVESPKNLEEYLKK